MNARLSLSLDAMGGDHGPQAVLGGADMALSKTPELFFHLYGDKAAIEALLPNWPKLSTACEVHHTEVSISMTDKPSLALRRGRGKSSMWQALQAVHDGLAQAAVSSGNTGALMAMSHFVLKTLPGISRPAIAAIWPTMRGESIVLDVGATIGADAAQLVEFAIMGEAMARCLFGVERPTVGLLNVGVEEIKGVEQVKEAGKLLRDIRLPMEYAGFVEGDDIAKGTVDVIVTEGFTGNIALKTAEGTARYVTGLFRQALVKTWLNKLGALLARGALTSLKEELDPRRHNGGTFTGLNGIVVKSHGSSDALGFSTAIDLAVNMVRNGLVAKIAEDVAAMTAIRSPIMQVAE